MHYCQARPGVSGTVAQVGENGFGLRALFDDGGSGGVCDRPFDRLLIGRSSIRILGTYIGRQDTGQGRPFRFILNHSKTTERILIEAETKSPSLIPVSLCQSVANITLNTCTCQAANRNVSPTRGIMGSHTYQNPSPFLLSSTAVPSQQKILGR